MSSKAGKLEKKVEAEKNIKKYTLYGSLIGSCIVTIGKLANKTEDFMLEDFAKLAKDEELAKCKNVKEVCDYIIKRYEMAECFKDNLVLVFDEENKYTPIVTIMDEEGYILPLDRDGNYVGILAQLGNKESIGWENIYDEEEEDISGQ